MKKTSDELLAKIKQDAEGLVQEFDRIQTMTLRPGDVLVFRTPLKISSRAETDIKAHLEDLTGHSTILVLDAGAEVSVLRPEAEPESSQPWWRFW